MPRKKIVLFVHDGTGLGHLQRICKLVRALQEVFSCLVITGHRSAAWLVPEESEFIHIPSQDSLVAEKAAIWGRRPFVDMTWNAIAAFRNSLISQSVQSFGPDAIIVDYLPLGKNRELLSVLESSSARKYLILRGILGERKSGQCEILERGGQEVLEKYYDRIFISSDRRICDVLQDYSFPSAISRKFIYVGYISAELKGPERDAIRAERGIPANGIWIVCSAGGGLLARQLVAECNRLPSAFPSAWFDFVAGPRSDNAMPCRATDITVEGRARYWKEHKYLSKLHGAADIVICPGGYNSMVEAMEGGSRLISSPVQVSREDEQYIHTKRLSKYYPLKIVEPEEIPAVIVQEYALAGIPISPNGREILDFNGTENIKRILQQDLDA